MRIHLKVQDTEGRVLKEDSFESGVVSVGTAEHNMFSEGHLPRFDIVTDGYYAAARWQRASGLVEQRLQRRNLIEVLPPCVLHVDLYPRPDAVPKQRGVCPSCGDQLVESLGGGAYRSIARRERRCPTCASIVLALNDAPEVLGRFADQSVNDWVHVTVSSRCPQCLESMSRAVYASEHGSVEVERCIACALVVLDSEDQRRLKGR